LSGNRCISLTMWLPWEHLKTVNCDEPQLEVT
jgi:hypothetical protein